MLSHGQEALNDFGDEEFVSFGFGISAQNVNKFLGQLKVRRLEAHIFSWRPVEDETEIDVDEVPVFVDHDVSVMSILDLQDIADDAVSCQTFCKVESGFLEAL